MGLWFFLMLTWVGGTNCLQGHTWSQNSDEPSMCFHGDYDFILNVILCFWTEMGHDAVFSYWAFPTSACSSWSDSSRSVFLLWFVSNQGSAVFLYCCCKSSIIRLDCVKSDSGYSCDVQVNFNQKKTPFLHFVTNVCAIVGGTMLFAFLSLDVSNNSSAMYVIWILSILYI